MSIFKFNRKHIRHRIDYFAFYFNHHSSEGVTISQFTLIGNTSCPILQVWKTLYFKFDKSFQCLKISLISWFPWMSCTSPFGVINAMIGCCAIDLKTTFNCFWFCRFVGEEEIMTLTVITSSFNFCRIKYFVVSCTTSAAANRPLKRLISFLRFTSVFDDTF